MSTGCHKIHAYCSWQNYLHYWMSGNYPPINKNWTMSWKLWTNSNTATVSSHSKPGYHAFSCTHSLHCMHWLHTAYVCIITTQDNQQIVLQPPQNSEKQCHNTHLPHLCHSLHKQRHPHPVVITINHKNSQTQPFLIADILSNTNNFKMLPNCLTHPAGPTCHCIFWRDFLGFWRQL